MEICLNSFALCVCVYAPPYIPFNNVAATEWCTLNMELYISAKVLQNEMSTEWTGEGGEDEENKNQHQ